MLARTFIDIITASAEIIREISLKTAQYWARQKPNTGQLSKKAGQKSPFFRSRTVQVFLWLISSYKNPRSLNIACHYCTNGRLGHIRPYQCTFLSLVMFCIFQNQIGSRKESSQQYWCREWYRSYDFQFDIHLNPGKCSCVRCTLKSNWHKEIKSKIRIEKSTLIYMTIVLFWELKPATLFSSQ